LLIVLFVDVASALIRRAWSLFRMVAVNNEWNQSKTVVTLFNDSIPGYHYSGHYNIRGDRSLIIFIRIKETLEGKMAENAHY
jgi:hypothetical protein